MSGSANGTNETGKDASARFRIEAIKASLLTNLEALDAEGFMEAALRVQVALDAIDVSLSEFDRTS